MRSWIKAFLQDGFDALPSQPQGGKQSALTPAVLWEVAGRPHVAPSRWQHERPLMLVLDNYSVHKSQVIATARPTLEAANIYLVYLPSYCPKLSLIESVWNHLKQQHLPTWSVVEVGDLKRAVHDALVCKA